MTALLCDACGYEPRTGKIDVPEVGDFGIGSNCYGLHARALSGHASLRDVEKALKLKPSDPAAEAWKESLLSRLKTGARCFNCKHDSNSHSVHAGCRLCLCPHVNPLSTEELEVA